MARYYRSGRRYRRYGGRYWRRNWWRRGVARAQKQGTRRFTISIPIEGFGSVPIGATSYNSTPCGFTPFLSTNRAAGTPTKVNTMGSLIGSNLFSTYCNLYDEVKLNSVYLEVAVTGLPESKQAVKVVTCVDRHATIDDIDTFYSVPNMLGSAECDSKMFTSLTYAKVSRYFRARDRQENTIFVDSTLGTVEMLPGTVNVYTNGGIKEFLDNGNLYGALNPLISLGFVLGSATTAASTISFQYRVVWNLTFRNPKYGASSASRGVSDVKGDVSDGEIERLKMIAHEDVQLPLTDEDTRMSMDDYDKVEKGS